MIDQEKLDKEQLRAEIYDPFRAIMDGIEARVLERPLEKMWFSAMWEIKHIEKAVERGGGRCSCGSCRFLAQLR